ncbi:alkaline phosphatase family protein [Aquimarina addita]|uniref:Alkaline phosphatase family protein n=2 Tax=Aquimarina addita TaxID=870485 RepID=A0ABP7X9C9_9FLAO
MRFDYITRFSNHYENGGFKKLIEQGFFCKNHHFNYVPTTTAAGHASIHTGTTPQNHGIIGNYWFNRKKKEKIYCVEDLNVSPVGTSSSNGRRSPSQLGVTTIADQNRLHTQMKGKTISISIKDRAAILSGGHTANAAYWFRGKGQGSWISSSHYIDKLPKWVIDFNESNIIDSYFKPWQTMYPIDTYTESGLDNTKFERGFKGKETATFPYDLQQLKTQNGDYDILRHTPYGNSLTVDFAISALKGEKLGKDSITDFLLVSFSSTDYIGHNFGVNSKEIEDTYIRLDKDLKRLLKNLDTEVGINNYTVFLTSDHGATHVPRYLKSKKAPAGYFKEASFGIAVKNFVKKQYALDSIIENISNNQVFLNHKKIKEYKLSSSEIERTIAKHMLEYSTIDRVFTRSQLENTTFNSGIASSIQKGFHMTRSGDVFFVINPSTIAYAKTGSAHGSGYTYDTHVPLIFYGKGINKGYTYTKTYVSDIAPTISTLIGIEHPNGTTGTVITEVIE